MPSADLAVDFSGHGLTRVPCTHCNQDFEREERFLNKILKDNEPSLSFLLISNGKRMRIDLCYKSGGLPESSQCFMMELRRNVAKATELIFRT